MVQRSEDTREDVLTGTEERLYSDIDTVIFHTSMGDFTAKIENVRVPRTSANFAKLVDDEFYDGQRFHRVIDGFMIQGGDPLSKDLSQKNMWGRGGPGYTFPDEFVDGLSNVSGTIAMANSGPNTNGSQFFINVKDNKFLDGKHTVFGRVIDGMDVVMKISQVERDSQDRPLQDVIINSIEIKH